MEEEEISGDLSRPNEVKTPKVGMTFSSEHEVREFYDSYAGWVGFDTSKLWAKKGKDGRQKYLALGCSKFGKAVKTHFNPRTAGNTECKARMNVKVLYGEVYVISGFHSQHNHHVSPGKSRHLRSNKELDSHIKRKMEINDKAKIGLNKTLQSFDAKNQTPRGGSEIPIIPSNAPTKLQTVFEGKYDESCSVRGFHDSLDCEEIPLNKTFPYQYRVFWYPENATSVTRPPSNSIQPKIKAFLLKLGTGIPNYWIMQDLVQFWVPITTEDGREVLSVSKQPFGVRTNLKGLCRYRYCCLDYCSNGRAEVGDDFGPVGRAFARGSPEFCPDAGIYLKEDFPIKFANHCGIVGYLALPLFELGGRRQQSSVGVLEFVSFTKRCLSSYDTRIFIEILKEVGLAIRYPSHSPALTEVKRAAVWLKHSVSFPSFPSLMCIDHKALEFLIQIRPYFNFSPPGDACKGKLDEISSVLDSVRKAYNLPLIQVWLPCICDGSEVSIACELNSNSFSKNTHLVCGLKCLDRDERVSDWLSSYASCDSQVYFVEDGESWVGRAHSLRKICFVRDISQYCIEDYPLVALGHASEQLACFAVPLQLVNPMPPPLVLELFLAAEYDFDTDQGAILKPLLSMVARELSKYNADFGLRQEEECFIEISHSNKDYDCVYFDVYHGLPVVVEEDYVQHQGYQPNDATEIEEIQVIMEENTRPLEAARSTLKRKHPSFGAHPVQQTIDSLDSIDSSDEDQQSGISHRPNNNSKEKQEEAALTLIPIHASTTGTGASIETGNHEIGKGKNTETENDKVRKIVPENDEVDHSCIMIAKARYKDDIVRFPFSSNSGIEGLRRDLLKRFELEAPRIKIKYQDGGEWIMLSCSEDLSFHMRSLVSSGQTTLDLSVFPTT